MKSCEPALDQIEDYGNKGSIQKRLTVWIVILSGLLIGAVYGMINATSSVKGDLHVKTGILKY